MIRDELGICSINTSTTMQFVDYWMAGLARCKSYQMTQLYIFADFLYYYTDKLFFRGFVGGQSKHIEASVSKLWSLKHLLILWI